MERNEGETDAHYIARLETSRAQLKANNDRLSKDHKRLYKVMPQAVQTAGAVLQAASEILGIRDRKDIVATVAALEKLGSCVWHDDYVEVPAIDRLPAPTAELPSDMEMILKSSLEAALCECSRRLGRIPDITPKDDPPPVNPARAMDEISQILDELDFSRAFLRYDMRAAMYEYVFQRIGKLANGALKFGNNESLCETRADAAPF